MNECIFRQYRRWLLGRHTVQFVLSATLLRQPFVDAQAHGQLFGMKATVKEGVEAPVENGAATTYKTA